MRVMKTPIKTVRVPSPIELASIKLDPSDVDTLQPYYWGIVYVRGKTTELEMPSKVSQPKDNKGNNLVDDLPLTKGSKNRNKVAATHYAEVYIVACSLVLKLFITA